MNVPVVNGSVMNVDCCERSVLNGSVLNGHPSKYSFTIVHYYYNKCFGKNTHVHFFISFHCPQIF